jgi:hypothetical protein
MGPNYLPTAGEGPVTTWNGLYAATVVSNNDPLGVGRLQLQIPQVFAGNTSGWAVPFGTYFSVPGVGTTVSAMFIGGDPSQPVWGAPLDIDPIVAASAPPTVTYSPTDPPDPRVKDVWYETSIIAGNTVIAAPQVWTFDSMTSTFSWVTQGGIVNNNTLTEAIISASTFLGTDFVQNSFGTFFYSGTPASGNLIASVSNATGSDAAWTSGSGNAYLAGVVTYLFDATHNVYISAAHVANGLNFARSTLASGPWISAGSQLTLTPTGLFLEANALTIAAGTTVQGGLAVNDFITATGGNSTTPTVITTDTWHAASLLNGWANQGGGLYECQYKLMEDNSVWLIGVINPAAMTSTQFMTLPVAYRPQNTGGDYPLGEHTTAPLGTNGAFLRVQTTGACSLINATTGSGAIIVNIRIPLDNI